MELVSSELLIEKIHEKEWKLTSPRFADYFSSIKVDGEEIDTYARDVTCNKSAVNAMKQLTKAIKADVDYAHSWVCNLATMMTDVDVNHSVANTAAVDFIARLFSLTEDEKNNLVSTYNIPYGIDERNIFDELLGECKDIIPKGYSIDINDTADNSLREVFNKWAIDIGFG
jgi:hypothetical protein